MNFSEYLNESALLVSDSMKKYVDDALDNIKRAVESCVTYSYFKSKYNRKEVYNDDVESKYGNYNISTIIRIPYENSPLAIADSKEKTISIFISNDDYLKMNDSKFKDTVLKEYKKVLLHELLHLVDPKRNIQKLTDVGNTKITELNKKIKLKLNELKTEENPDKIKEIENDIETLIQTYLKFDWEIDAFISSESEEIAEEIIKKSRNLREALTYIKNFTPENNTLKFYKTQPKIWKRFVLHLVKLIEREFK